MKILQGNTAASKKKDVNKFDLYGLPKEILTFTKK